MKGVLSGIGIGSATAATILSTDTVRASESIQAAVHAEGGSTDQMVDAVYFAFETEYKPGEGCKNAIIEHWQLTELFTVAADEEQRFEACVSSWRLPVVRCA